MSSLSTPQGKLGTIAPDFDLLGTDGRHYRLRDVRGPNGLLVMFICNHCPYVKAIREPLVDMCKELEGYGIGSVAISSNDTTTFPEDDFEHMKAYAKAYHFGFPYLFDETQSAAKAYGAVCTPDFFGFDSQLALQYRGRFDSSTRHIVLGAKRELFEAMRQIAMLGNGPMEQIPSVGCSIKWRTS